MTGSKSLWFNSKRIVQRLWDPLILRREHLFGEVKNTNEIVFMSAGSNPRTICTAIQTELKEISTRSTRTPYPLHRRQLLYQLIQRRSPPDQIEPRNFCTEDNRSINWSKGDLHWIKSNPVPSARKTTALSTDPKEISTRSNRTPCLLHRRQPLYQLIQRRSPLDQIEPHAFCTKGNHSINWFKWDLHQIKSNPVISAPKTTALSTALKEIYTRSNCTHTLCTEDNWSGIWSTWDLHQIKSQPRNFCTEDNRSINWSKGDLH